MKARAVIIAATLLILGLVLPLVVQGQTAKEPPSRPRQYVPGQVLVRFAAGTTAAAKQRLRDEFAARVGKTVPLIQVELWQLPATANVDQVISRLRQRREIDHAEPNYLSRPQQLPDDPLFPRQWYLENSGQQVKGVIGRAGADMGLPAAWDLTTGSHEMVVAVIDSGVAIDHPDLKDNIWTNPGEIPANGIDDDHNGYIDDLHGWDFVNNDANPSDYSRDMYGDGHGTHVAGLIAAEGDNGTGIAGVMWHAQIMPLQIFDLYEDNSFGSSLIQAINILSAIGYAINNGARIINCSFGSPAYSQYQYDILQLANEKDILVVCAAGNEGVDNDLAPTYPGSYDLPNIIAVTATTEQDRLADYANYGHRKVDVAAPGGNNSLANIYSTIPPERKTLFRENFEDWTTTSTNWNMAYTQEGWSIACYSGNCFVQDSRGNYHNNEYSYLRMKNPIRMDNIRGLYIGFDYLYQLEDGYDFLSLDVSVDGRNFYAAAEFTGLSTGWNSYREWHSEENYGDFYLGFTLETDKSGTYDGVYLDNIEITGIPWVFKGSEYGCKRGTSMAAPLVSGVAGLLWSLNPRLTCHQVRELILDTVDPLPTLATTTVSGGRVNAARALEQCQSWMQSPEQWASAADCLTRGQGYWYDGACHRRPRRETVAYDGRIDQAPVSLGPDLEDGRLTAGDNLELTVAAERLPAGGNYALIMFPDDSYYFLCNAASCRERPLSRNLVALEADGRRDPLLSFPDVCRLLPGYRGTWQVYFLNLPAATADFADLEALGAYLEDESHPYSLGYYQVQVDCPEN